MARQNVEMLSRRSPGTSRTAARRSRLITAALLPALFAGVLVLALAIDATWLRPLIQHHVQERSQRRIEFESLRFGLTPALDPTITFRDLFISNAPWADARPFAKAGEVRFEVTWSSLWSRPIIVKRLTLRDADVDMERSAEGLRNWRLTRPLDTGPGEVRVQTLVAQRSTVRVVEHGEGLAVELTSSELAPSQSLAEAPGLPLTQHIVFNGRRNGLPFSGEADTSDVLTFVDSGADFALRGRVQAAGANLQVRGRAGDLRRLERADVALHLVCNTLADLAKIFPSLALPASRPLTADLHLQKRERDWQFSALTAKLGNTVVDGNASLQTAGRDGERQTFAVSLRSPLVDMKDMAGLFQSPRGAGPRPLFDPAVLQANDGRFDLTVGKAINLGLGSVTDLRVAGVLQAGVLKVDPLRFAAYGGNVSVAMQVDAARTPPQVALDARAEGVQLAALLRSMPAAKALQGELQSRFNLRSQGTTLAALASTADGSARLSLGGASIPARVEAKLALDGGRWLAALVKGNPQVAVRCAQLAIDFRAGRGTARRLLVETEHARVHGSGSVNLADTTFEMLLTPRALARTWLALDRSIEVKGSGLHATTRLVAASPVPSDALGCSDDAAGIAATK